MAAAKPKLASVPPAPEASEAPAPPKKRSKVLLIIIAVLVLAIGGAGGWYFFLRPGHKAGQEAEAPKKIVPPTFVNLEPFTVNLLEENGDHYLQVGIVYQVHDSKTVDAMKTYMPVLRNRILFTLSSKRPSELASLEGKNQLVKELIAAARQSIPGDAAEGGVKGAFLSSFVIQ